MRASVLLLGLGLLNCSAEPGAAGAGSSRASASASQRPVSSSSAATVPSASSNVSEGSAKPVVSSSAGVPIPEGVVLEDGEAAVAKLAPFEAGLSAQDLATRTDAAIAICGPSLALDAEPWGRAQDKAGQPIKPQYSNCAATTLSKLYLQRALAMEAKDAELQKGYFALALAADPAASLPASSAAPLTAAFTAAKKVKSNVRAGAVSSSDESMTSALEATAASMVPYIRVCHVLGLRNNPNVQGRITLNVVLDGAGRVIDASDTTDLPDSGVAACARSYGARATYPKPKGPFAKLSLPFLAVP